MLCCVVWLKDQRRDVSSRARVATPSMWRNAGLWLKLKSLLPPSRFDPAEPHQRVIMQIHNPSPTVAVAHLTSSSISSAILVLCNPHARPRSDNESMPWLCPRTCVRADSILLIAHHHVVDADPNRSLPACPAYLQVPMPLSACAYPSHHHGSCTPHHRSVSSLPIQRPASPHYALFSPFLASSPRH